MAYSVSNTFRTNCYDDTKKQRIAFLASDGTMFTNEDISVSDKVKFNIASCKSQQITFGELPCNTISLTLLNEDGRISASDIAKEYTCYIGVEVSDADYEVGQSAISAVRNTNECVSVHSVAPYIRGNIQLGTTINELSNGYPCKILLSYNTLYFVVRNGSNTYYGKHVKTGAFTYGNNQTPSDLEKAELDRLMDNKELSGLSLYKTGFEEYYKAVSTTTTLTVWNTLKGGTWNDVKDHKWSFYSGVTKFGARRFEAIPYGVWHFDRPRRVNTAVITLSGKDRMDRFDEDSKGFTAANGTIVLNMRNVITTIAAYKGVNIGSLSSLNGLAPGYEYFTVGYMEGKSLKDLLSYALEVCAVNGIIDREGYFSSISNSNTAIELPYVYSFDVADCVAHTIGSALVYKQGDYEVYQTDGNISNGATYDWQDNPMFSNSNPGGSWFSNNMHVKYGGFNNAITVTDADYSLWSDDVYSWTQDGVTYTEPIFSMSVEWDGFGRVTYTNYGDEERQYANYNNRMNAVSSVNDVNLQGFNQAKYADKLYFDSNGLTVESRGLRIKNANGDIVFDADDDGNLVLQGTIDALAGEIGKWLITQDGLLCNKTGENWGLEIYSDGLDFRTPENYELAYVKFRDASGDNPRSLELMTNSANNVEAEIWLTCKTARFRTSAVQIYGDVSFDSTSATFRVKASTVRFDNSIELDNIPTTTTAANTTLVSSTNGYKIHRVSSLRAVKDNIKTIENASEKVDTLRGVSFTSKCESDDPKRVLYGFIAEEVEKAVPELASYEDGKLQSVQYDRVCALLVEDNKACHKRIADLEARLERLEKMINGN